MSPICNAIHASSMKSFTIDVDRFLSPPTVVVSLPAVASVLPPAIVIVVALVVAFWPPPPPPVCIGVQTEDCAPPPGLSSSVIQFLSKGSSHWLSGDGANDCNAANC